jgi:hypothetical protein
MRTDRTITTLALALLLGACGTRQDKPAALSDDLKRDLAAASSSGGDLATAPQSFQPMRFVSAVERSASAAPVKRMVVSRRRGKVSAGHRAGPMLATESAPEPTVAAAAEAPAPVAASEAATPEPTVVAQQPTAEPVNAPAPAPAGSGSDGGVGERRRGGGWGGILGGIIGAVVIRGGIGGVDKCDPRTDGRARIPVTDRPEYGIPLPTGQPTFPGSRRR